MSTYGSGVYGSGTYSLGESIAISRIRIFKSINDKVTNFQVLADKERILLYWDPISRSIPFKALAVDGNDIHLSTIVDRCMSLPSTAKALNGILLLIGSQYNNILSLSAST